MDRKSKIFFIVFVLLIAGSVAVTYYRYMVERDYIIQAEMECDPYEEACFVYVCDPEAGEECTGDPLEDTWYYKLISRNAKNIPLCDPNEEDCEALTCPLGEAECEMTLCDVGNADGIECTDPVAYAAEYPLEEEEDGDAIEAEEDGAEDDTATAEEAALVDETISETEASIPATDTVAPAQ